MYAQVTILNHLLLLNFTTSIDFKVVQLITFDLLGSIRYTAEVLYFSFRFLVCAELPVSMVYPYVMLVLNLRLHILVLFEMSSLTGPYN